MAVFLSPFLEPAKLIIFTTLLCDKIARIALLKLHIDDLTTIEERTDL
jgi:hypothetical protein